MPTRQLQIEEYDIGSDRDYPLKIRTRAGNVVTSYKTDNPLTAAIWEGDTLATIARPTVTWRNPGLGTATLHVRAADFADPPEAGRYVVMCYVGEIGHPPRPIAHFYLDFLAGPGSGVPRGTYGTLDQMAAIYAPVVDLLKPTDQTNFAEQRAGARDDLVALIERHWDGRKSDAEATGWDVFRGYRRGYPRGYAHGWGRDWAWYRPPPRDLPWLRGVLDAGGLVVTPMVRRLAALRALAIVLRGQVTQDAAAVAGGRQSAHEPALKDFEAQYADLIRTFVAEVDADGDGAVDFHVDCRDRASVA